MNCRQGGVMRQMLQLGECTFTIKLELSLGTAQARGRRRYSGKELYKESRHLVWRDIILSKERAAKVRQFTIKQFGAICQMSNQSLRAKAS